MKNQNIELSFSKACENNKNPILTVLQKYLTNQKVLEIGSGTGQHAVYFAKKLPNITWMPTDLPDVIHSLNLRFKTYVTSNIKSPLILNVNKNDWPDFDAIFTANTLHIMSWESVINALNTIACKIPNNGLCFFYGPFIYNGTHTSQSNVIFDQHLKQCNIESGIRDVKKIKKIFVQKHIQLLDDVAMPANNRMLIWKKTKKLL